METIKFDKEDKYVNDFIKLANKIYDKNDNMEDPNTIKSLLLEKHPLSKYFKLDKFLIYDDKDVVGRFAITRYPDDKNTCYIGFFECIKDKKAAKELFKAADKFAKDNGYKNIIGPVDASFWIKYRLKINKFERPYTCEPYNKDYYFDLFNDNGYVVKEHYVSNRFEGVDETYKNPKFKEHYDEFINLGYEIVKPKDNEFDKCMKEVYKMVSDLYNDFPIYKDVKEKDFLEVYSSLKKIINMDMVRIAYFKGKPVGFYISVPNYNNLVYHLNAVNIAKILKIKKKPKDYVMLYMGVEKGHTGLGKALVYSIMLELMESGLPSIGALARDGKINAKYAEEMIDSQYEYVLLGKEV
jgi:hypothetical protein